MALKLVRKFEADPGEVRRLQSYRDPTSAELDRAREYTRRMRERGQLRSPRRRVPPAVPPATEQFVRERFAQGWSKSRLARELFLDRRLERQRLPVLMHIDAGGMSLERDRDVIVSPRTVTSARKDSRYGSERDAEQGQLCDFSEPG